jgi:hypothetical protein
VREIAIGSTQNIVEEGDAWGRSLARENIVTSERRAEEALVHIQLLQGPKKRLHMPGVCLCGSVPLKDRLHKAYIE